MTITKRLITLDDFLKLKKFAPFSKHRHDSKQINFGAIFACSGPTLGNQMLSAGFSEEDCDKTMETFNLTDLFESEVITKGLKGDEITSLKYKIIGNKLRELFFQTYPCLLKRVEREQKFALKHGYVRSWTGPVRHLSELNFMKYSYSGELIGADKKLYSSDFASLKNDACNTTIQTAEVYQAMPDATTIGMNLKKWNFRSKIFNYVHDSIEMYVHKEERSVVYALLNEVAQIHRQPYFNIPMHIDVEEADLDIDGQYFKHGVEVNIEKFDLKEELKKYNESHGTNLEFESWIPIIGEVSDSNKWRPTTII
jgi:DNA polymerase I-like protein with 3'-5' exonuclease and polymerase domains